MSEAGTPVAAPSQAWKVLVIVGLAVVGLGLVLLLTPIKAGGVNCGSAVHKTDAGEVADILNLMTGYEATNSEDACDAARSSRQPLAWGALVVGIAVLVGGVVIRPAPAPKP